MPTMELPARTPLPDRSGAPAQRVLGRVLRQFLRFGLVGCLNTGIDLLALNCLLWLWPAQNMAILLLANSLAYALGAVNSFMCNKYWTFRCTTRTNTREVARFVLTTLVGIACNDLILSGLNSALPMIYLNTTFWMNISKLLAISGTILISYLGMRLWVFVRYPQQSNGQSGRLMQSEQEQIASAPEQAEQPVQAALVSAHSLSVVLPAYNEEHAIAATVERVLHVLANWLHDFEVIVVNDGSSDGTATILARLSANDTRVRVVTHERNQGYGATLADGFAAAQKTLTFFMDADGQFDIRDLEQFLALIDAYDAVIGYRLQRQDTWMRKLNAWGWKIVTRLALGLRVRDIDCAFKLLRTAFLHAYPLETRGAMINAELLYKLKRAGCTTAEVGVHHLPRQGGRATGARPGVIARAFHELFVYAHRWRGEERNAHHTSSSQGKNISRPLLQKEDTATMRIDKIAWNDGSGFFLDGTRALLPRLWQRLVLSAVMLISIFVNFYQLGQNGFGNLFYAAGVRSMADSLHNFFFVSYDPGGFVTVDKPPLGFWLQAISVKIFGFTPFSIFLPQALSGVLAVLVLFILVRRHFGVPAGLLAALALALSPLSVATGRNNTIDSILALTLLLGAWAVMRAAESGKWRWLLLSAALVGIGFNIKMAEAYLVVPAFGLLYLLAAPRTLWIRGGQLAVALLLMLAISLSWAVVVDLVPASQRPYVGSSQNNSEVGLALGYNGVDRLIGRFGFRGGNRATPGVSRQLPSTALERATISANGNMPNAPVRRVGGGFGRFGSGTPGPLRLFNEPLAGQISWLLPVALLGMLALAWQRRPRFRGDPQQQSLLLWGMWLATMAGFFSVAGFFHQYYMTTFAPAICALFGIGLVVMWHDYHRFNWRWWLLPLALLVTAFEQIHIIHSNPTWGTWLIPLIAISCVLVAAVLVVARLTSQYDVNPRVLVPTLGCGIAALLLAPAIWSAIPALQNVAASTPVAGRVQQGRFGRLDNTTENPALIRYLLANRGNTKFLVATPSSMSANAIILATNQPVMAMGGFSGRDPILTTNQLASLVGNGTVRFFLLNGPTFGSRFFAGNFPGGTQHRYAGFFGAGRSSQSTLTSWVTHHCAAVSQSQWQPGATSAVQKASASSLLLYDCATMK